MLLQHDARDRVILQHRTSAKWNAFGENWRAPDFPLHDACLAALAALRARWDGRTRPSPAPIEGAAARLPTPGRFLYRRIGADERVLALLPTGDIGAGSAANEREWRLRRDQRGNVVLAIQGEHGPTCDLLCQADGVWRGRWRHYERMPIELIPLDAVAGARSPGRWFSQRPLATPAGRPRLLFLSPVIPARTGNGLAMRAGTMLEALAARHRVTLLVVAHYPTMEPVLGADLAALCDEVAILAPDSARWAASATGRRRRHADGPELPFVERRFVTVHVFRLAMLPYARPYLGPRIGRGPRRQLDLDDIESVSNEQIARLYRWAGDSYGERVMLRDAAVARRQEAWALARFDTVFVCSFADRDRLEERANGAVHVLPNVVRVPAALPPCDHTPFTFLFVGTLAYYPNVDALRYFCREVLPHLRRLAPDPFRLRIVGIGAGAGIDHHRLDREVEVVGAVSDVGPSYRQAGAVVVPIRAGGGTRIKVLEAFSYWRPVVSTSIGTAGIAVQAGRHLLVADTPEAFARACAQLMRDPVLAATLAQHAHDLVRSAYAPETLAWLLDALA